MDYHALNNFVVMVYVLFSSQLYILVSGSLILVEATTVLLREMSILWRGFYSATN
jgi:hypothetical protein